MKSKLVVGLSGAFLALGLCSSNAQVPVTFGDIGYIGQPGGTDYHFFTGTSNTIGFAQRQTHLSFYWDDRITL